MEVQRVRRRTPETSSKDLDAQALRGRFAHLNLVVSECVVRAEFESVCEQATVRVLRRSGRSSISAHVLRHLPRAMQPQMPAQAKVQLVGTCCGHSSAWQFECISTETPPSSLSCACRRSIVATCASVMLRKIRRHCILLLDH